MPVISGGGGGTTPTQVATSGKVLPVAHATATVDTTTYPNPIGSGKLTTLVFAADDAALAIALSGDAFPRWLLAADAADGLYFGDGTFDPDSSNGAYFAYSGTHGIAVTKRLETVSSAATPTEVPQLSQLSPFSSITSGALPSFQLVSGAGRTASSVSDVETHTPVTFNPGAATIATCKVELSPDNVTYSTLAIWTVPVGVVLDGTIQDVIVRVPAAWFLKLTVSATAALGLTTFY